jgi:ribosomal protein S18 acetylase RimI-like enzyme
MSLSNFLMKGILKNPLHFCITMSAALARHPRKLGQILKASQLEKALKTTETQEAAILTFGVLPEFRDRKFLRRSGVRISNELFEYAIAHLRRHKMSRVRLLIEPTNTEALLFYTHYGCKFDRVDTLGRTLIKVTYPI